MKRVVILLLAFVFSLSLFSGCGKAVVPATAGDYLALGEKFLLELDYEQALVQFLKVIEIDPMEPRGYTGAAEAYVGLGEPEMAIEVLKLGVDKTDDESVRRDLAEQLAIPHMIRRDTDDGGLFLVYGQEDLEGRLQGFCIMNIFDAEDNLINISEGEYVDDLAEGELKNWWIPDTNINAAFGVENGCGRGIGECKHGERYGSSYIECYIGFVALEREEGQLIRFDQCSGVELVHVYSGNMIDDRTEHDDTGNAYMMSIDAATGDKYEMRGQFEYGRFVYGEIWMNGVLRHEGAMGNQEEAEPADNP